MMDARTDVQFTRSNSSQLTLGEGAAVDHDPGNAALNENTVLDSYSLPSPNIHLGLATHGSDLEAHDEQNPIHPFNLDQGEPTDTRMEGNKMVHEPSESDSNQGLPVLTKDVSPPECVVALVGRSPSSTDTNDTDVPINDHPGELPLLRARAVSLETFIPDESAANLDGHFNPTQTLLPDGSAPRTDEGETLEEFDRRRAPCLPPSSSPPQLFSSSPYASSQSSADDVEPSKVLAIEVEHHMMTPVDARADNVHDDLVVEFEVLHGYDTSTIGLGKADACHLQTSTGHTSRIKSDLELSRKRSADHDELHSPEPIKRQKPESRYLPPTPKRPTPASQSHQFKKLIAPFRPPLKVPAVADSPAKATSSMKDEPTISTALKTNRDKIEQKGSTTAFRHKSSNTQKSLTQFKSPLVNRALPADSCTVRLTPALQALERKLQLLKRAIKVKEGNEEEVLTRLSGKWIEAGREVAYEVWDSTKDAGDFTAKTFIGRSYSWENTNDKNVPWGWDTKVENAAEEPCDLNASEASRALAPGEDEDVGCNTLGTMLRQLGIDPEIFGWDDDRETFSD